MGVDYFPCAGCQEIICDCGEFYVCQICSDYFCPECYKKLRKDGFEHSENGLQSCWFCTKDRQLRRVTNEELVKWLMKISGKSSEDYLNYLAEQGEFDPSSENSEENTSDQDSSDQEDQFDKPEFIPTLN